MAYLLLLLIADDYNRVILDRTEDSSETDYINASFINVSSE